MFGDWRLSLTANFALPLLQLLVLLIVSSPGCLSAIQLPQPGNQANVATGTTNLMITATVTTSPSACSWSGTGLTVIQFYSSLFGCSPSSTSTHNITCTNSAGVTNTTLTYLTALTSNSTIFLNCDSAVVNSLSMIIKDCKPNMGSGVIATTNPTSSCGFGCTVQYSCASGYTGSDVNATCQEDATFDGIDPVCDQITCANSDLLCSNPQYCFNQTGSTNAGTNVAIPCNTGYNGSVSAACGNDGSWTITPQSPCPALCPVSDITSSPGRCTTATGDILEGQSITVTCCNGYAGVSTMAVCTSDRSWSNLPTCTKTGPTPSTLSTGAIIGIVFGCLVAAALITFVLIAIFCTEICCCTFSILCLSWGTKN